MKDLLKKKTTRKKRKKKKILTHNVISPRLSNKYVVFVFLVSDYNEEEILK